MARKARRSGSQDPAADAKPEWREGRRPDKIAEKLARQIIDDVVARDLGVGTMLPPESEMSKAYGVGRYTLREALRLLEVQGVISMKPGPGGGPVLRRVNVSDFARNATVHLKLRRSTYKEVLEARLAIEPVLARMAAETQDEDRLNALRHAIQVADDADPRDEAQWQQASDLFHATIAGVSGNSVLDLLGMFLKEIYHSKPRAAVTPSKMRAHVREVHREIAQAIFDSDGPRAERLMFEHMKYYAMRSDKIHSRALKDEISW